MAKRPIFNAYIYFNYYSTKTIRLKKESSFIETFITTENIEELNQNQILINKILKKLKKKKDIKIEITKTKIINQHGYTNDRF